MEIKTYSFYCMARCICELSAVICVGGGDRLLDGQLQRESTKLASG